MGIVGLGYALRLQLRAREYRAPVYWLTVMMVAIFGTMAADGLHRGVGIPYVATTILYGTAVAAIFFLWHRSERTLSIHSITTQRRELYYWAAVLATFALGTAVGDLTAISLNLGFFGSALLFTAVIAVPAVAWWRFDLNPIVAFWAAYIVTRPLGASFADWLGKPISRTGLGLGDGTVSAMALVMFVALVAYVAAAQRPVRHSSAGEARARGAHPESSVEGATLQPSPAEG